MVELLLILDGASEPLGTAPTSLELARTPVLDGLARVGELTRVRTVAPGLPAGSESAIPALLGWSPDAPLDRGAVEAAAHGVALAPGERAWRVDAVGADGRRPGEARAAAAAERLWRELPRHRVKRVGGHRSLVWGQPPLPELPPGLGAWPEGELPPRTLDQRTTVIAAMGAAAGIGRLMGAQVVVPPGATGRADTDLAGKAAAAEAAADGGAERVVVHVGGPDEAAHERDGAAKVVAIERVDRELVARLAQLVREHAGTLLVCPDHACDPATGEHGADPVPRLRWPASDESGVEPTPTLRRAASDEPRGHADPRGRLTERAVAALPERALGAEVVRS